MALTITIKSLTVIGNKRSSTGYIAFDSSYPTGGESLVPRNIGLSVIDSISFEPNSGYFFQYDYTNKKVKVYYPTASHTHTENTAASYTQNATTASSSAAAGSEVANGTNLSALTNVRYEAIGV